MNVNCLALAYEENSMGRFLKESAKLNDKTDAAKLMNVVGKTLSTTGQQRLSFQDPLRGLQKVMVISVLPIVLLLKINWNNK